MKCVREDLKALITDVLVGEAEPSVKERVLSHLETCASCREDRDQTARVLGLLKEAPPWAAVAIDGAIAGGAEAASDQGDTLSVIQRQKIESLAARRLPARPAGKVLGVSMSFLAMAASLSAVGIALVIARRSSEVPIEPPAPRATASSIGQLPQAPEAPEVFPKVNASPEPSLTAPAAVRSRAPERVPMAPEAMSALKEQTVQEAGMGRALPQAAESTETSSLKKDLRTDDDKRRADEARAAAPAEGVTGGALGGAPAASAPEPAMRVGGNVAAPPLPLPAATAAPGERQGRPSGFDASAGRTAKSEEGVRAEGKLSGGETDRLRSMGYSRNRPSDRPVPPPAPPDMFFEAKGTNPFIVTEEDPQATFGLDVDTASYTLTRNYLNRGILPPPSAVRVEEFVNSFPNNVDASGGRGRDSVFAVRVDGAPNPLHPGYHILRVAMKAKDVDPRERKPAHLTFVIDVSGSMAAENRLGLVKRSLGLLVDKLDERDTIGIVVYGTNGRRVLSPTSAANRDRIMGAISRLHPEGSTNLQDGLDLGYEMAMESFDRRASNRVVLCTDGVANTGRTEADALLARIRSETKRGIDMMALGFGMGNYNDALLQRLADEGNGQYAYIDDLGEARAFFLRKLTSVLEVVARDAKAQVEFNPARVERYRLLGYEKRDVADRDFRNDSVDAGEINSGHSVTALFEVKLKGGPRQGKIGTARIRYKTGPRSEGLEFSREIVDNEVARNFSQASPAFRTAFVAARFAEHLRGSYWVKDEALSSVERLARDLPESQPTNELADLVGRAMKLQRPQGREDW